MTPKDTPHTATQGASGPKCKDGVTLCPYPTDCEIEGRCIDQGASESSEPLGRFGHHPDPAIDFCVEIEAIEAEIADLKAGLEPTMALQDRIDEAICFRVGGDARAVAAKNALRAALAQRQPADPQAPSQEALDARRWRYAHEEPEAMRHLLRLLLDGKGKPSDLDNMVDKLIASKAALAKGPSHE